MSGPALESGALPERWRVQKSESTASPNAAFFSSARICSRAPTSRALAIQEIQLDAGVDIKAAGAVACSHEHCKHFGEYTIEA